MVKANAILAVFSINLLIFMASIVYAGDRGPEDALPRATVSLAQMKFSGAETNRASATSISPGNTAARKNSEADAGGDASPDLAENKASGDTASAEPTDAAETASLGAGSGRDHASARRNNDAAAGAAPVFLGSADDTCMGSSSGGGQGSGFGFSLGSTWTDENCKMLKNARELKSHGHHAAAKARLCMDEDNALAFELAGEPCPRALPSAQAALKTIRAQNPHYRAATETGFQTAALTRIADQPSAESRTLKTVGGSGGEEIAGDSKVGTLLAMVMSAVNQVAASVSANFDVDWDGVSAMDGIE